MFAGFAICSARDETNPKRWGNAAFWALVATSFWFGDLLGDIGNGVLVLALVALAGFASARARGSKESTHGEERERLSARLRQQAVPARADHPVHRIRRHIAFNYTPLKGSGLIEPKAVTLVCSASA